MGRKIKGKKHRTVRYPEQQKRLRELKLYHKVNNPPKIIDDQEIPKSVRKIKDFKEKFQSLEEKYERKQLEKKNKKLAKKEKEKNLKLNKGNLIEKLLIQDEGEETIVINEYRPIRKKVNVIDNLNIIKTQSTTIKPLQTKNKNEELIKQKQNRKKMIEELKQDYPNIGKQFNIKPNKTNNITNNKTNKMVNINVNNTSNSNKKSKKLSKKQKDKIKIDLKQQEIDEDDIMFKPVYDKYEFGEIVHAPPKFTKRPRNTQVESKPGKKNNLLLKSLLNPNDNIEEQNGNTSLNSKRKLSQFNIKGKTNYIPDLKGKRKDLSIADRRRMEKEQSIAIAAYKKLKAEKWKMSSVK